jgi:hypothetical protein
LTELSLPASLRHIGDDALKGCTGTCTAAAQRGHREVLEWAHAQGCPFDESWAW